MLMALGEEEEERKEKWRGERERWGEERVGDDGFSLLVVHRENRTSNLINVGNLYDEPRHVLNQRQPFRQKGNRFQLRARHSRLVILSLIAIHLSIKHNLTFYSHTHTHTHKRWTQHGGNKNRAAVNGGIN